MVYSLLVEGLLSRKINVQQHLPSILHEIDNDLIYLPNTLHESMVDFYNAEVVASTKCPYLKMPLGE
jgi:hypothetical protein